MQCYRTREYVEDIECIEKKLRGLASLLDAIDVHPDVGIMSTSVQEREAHFGSHYNDPPTRTPFIKLLYAALDDLMLKILMLCAVLSMIVDWA